MVYIAVERCGMQKIVALIVFYQRIGTVLEKKGHDLEVEALARPKDWSSLRIAAFGVDICAGLEKEMAEGVVAVDGSPLLSDQCLVHGI